MSSTHESLNALNLTLTTACNLACAHCGASGSCSTNQPGGEELSLAEYRLLLDQAAALGCGHLILAGGEPFLREDIWDILKHAEEWGMSCAILSNGVLIDDEIAHRLASYKNIAYVRLSVDYADERMDRFRGMPGLVDTLFAAVRLLRARNIRVGVGMTILPDNLEEIGKLAEMSDAAGANFFRATPLMPIGRSAGMDLDPELFIEATAEMIRVAKSFQPFEFYTVIMPNDLREMGQSLLLTCPGGSRTASFDSAGRISRCPLSPAPDLPAFRDSSLAELWESLNRLQTQLKEEVAAAAASECGACVNLALCHGGCPAEREARGLSVEEPQPQCMKRNWKAAMGRIQVTPKIRRAVNNMVCMQSTQNAYKLPVCYRSSPLWWFPLAGQRKEAAAIVS